MANPQIAASATTKMNQKPHAIDASKGQPFDLALIPDYVPAEVFLENIGYFTPSSKKIKGIYIKEKLLAEVVGEDGTKQPIILKISANHELGLPITADLDYYRSFLKILDDLVEKEQPITGYIEGGRGCKIACSLRKIIGHG